MGKISRDCDKEWKKLELTPLSERICGLRSKSSLDRLIRKEDYVGLPTDSFIGQGRTYNFL